MAQNHVDLLKMQDTLYLMKTKRDQLYKLLLHLLQRFHSNFFLSYFISLYQSSLSSDYSLTDSLKKFKKLTKINSATLRYTIKTLSHYSEDSCVIFITLLQNIGTIKKVTNNLYDVIPILKVSEAIGKNINYMIP